MRLDNLVHNLKESNENRMARRATEMLRDLARANLRACEQRKLHKEAMEILLNFKVEIHSETELFIYDHRRPSDVFVIQIETDPECLDPNSHCELCDVCWSEITCSCTHQISGVNCTHCHIAKALLPTFFVKSSIPPKDQFSSSGEDFVDDEFDDSQILEDENPIFDDEHDDSQILEDENHSHIDLIPPIIDIDSNEERARPDESDNVSESRSDELDILSDEDERRSVENEMTVQNRMDKILADMTSMRNNFNYIEQEMRRLAKNPSQETVQYSTELASKLDKIVREMKENNGAQQSSLPNRYNSKNPRKRKLNEVQADNVVNNGEECWTCSFCRNDIDPLDTCPILKCNRCSYKVHENCVEFETCLTCRNGEYQEYP
ncbi:unnamed protein product [Caenorhabditis angaria]|uniref:Uncharacterized protein n=1 Tax=Caenorhabditis angaria TaxID=860376 RepID=A0A9P1N5N1_9PELO|nr:unnamed protein product [Caenorhabditis angaria]